MTDDELQQISEQIDDLEQKIKDARMRRGRADEVDGPARVLVRVARKLRDVLGPPAKTPPTQVARRRTR